MENNEDVGLWRLTMTTVGRTLLAFMVPYFVAYYGTVGAWQGIQVLTLWLRTTG